MNLVSMDRLGLALKDGFLFDGLSLGIEEGDRMGLVGRNGSGKTSLLRLLAGELSADRGTIARRRGLEVSMLEQDPGFSPETTVGSFLFLGKAPEILLAGRHDASAGTGLYEDYEAGVEGYGPVSLVNRYSSICCELGLDDPDRLMSSLSGGQAKKAALARLFAPRSELLLLDEPTNHLDYETVAWLEARLIGSGSAFILVTHDRWFLDSVTTTMLEIDRRELWRHPGNYSDFLERRALRYKALEQGENRRLANLKIELAWLRRGARARAGKSERRKEDIRKMTGSALAKDLDPESFSSVQTRLGKKAIRFIAAGMSYDDNRVIGNFTWELFPGARVGIVGPNGSGKTTLLALAAGRLLPDQGQVIRGETVKLSFFEQSSPAIDPGMSVIDYVLEHAERIRLRDGTVLAAEDLLERFGFPRDFQALPVSKLSGGERRRLELVRLLAEAPNVLLLDEPTNDLDIETIELLEDYIESFAGALLVVSHDRAFLDRAAETLIVLDGKGGAVTFPGRFGDYLETRPPADLPLRGGSATREKAPASNEGLDAKEKSQGDSARQRLSFSERKELEGLLDEISLLEKEKGCLEALFSSGTADPVVLEEASRRYNSVGKTLDARTLRWEELAVRESQA
jgi:ATP-binding cassette subfamily F protein uup